MNNNSREEKLNASDSDISELIDQFYYRVLMDKTMRDLFLKADLGRIRYHQKMFFSQLLGGNSIYHGRDVYQVHESLGITNEQFNSFKLHLKEILDEMKKDTNFQDFVLSKVEEKRNLIVIEKKK